MAFKQINLNGGLNLQDSELKKGFNEFSDLQNLRHENGSLVKRYGTGAPTTVSGNTSCIINNAGILVHRKLTGVKIVDVDTNNISFTGGGSTNTMTIGGTINTDNVIIPGGSTDLRTIFKAGDTIVISTDADVDTGDVDTLADDGESSNRNKALVINEVTDANVITFVTTTVDETIKEDGESAQITFVFDRNNDGFTGGGDGVPNNLQINDANSFDGRALIVTYADGTNMEIGMLNSNDFGDLDTIATIANASDMHIRMRTYTDGVRFACGLDHSPLIFKYVNRQHFNGLLKAVYNSNAHTMYPRWFMDTAVPVLDTGTYTLETFKIDDKGGTNDSIRYINGTLNLEDNEYTYKFVPVYDGVQEGLLENALTTTSTNVLNRIPDKKNKNSVTSNKKGCMLSTTKIDLSKFNPRTSAINVYRSTNNGTYYKIKSIYMGDNDTNQHEITNAYSETDRVWFSGGNALTGGSEGTHTTLNSKVLMMDCIPYMVQSASGTNNYQSTGFKSVDLLANIEAALGNGLSRSEYGDMETCKFNYISEETEPILGGDDTRSGGSPNGGWYFASSSEKIATNVSGTNATDISGYDSDMNSDDSDYTTGNPFGYPYANGYSTGLDFTIANDGKTFTGNEIKLGGVTHRLNTGGTNLTGNFIVSGWVTVRNLDHPESSAKSYLEVGTSQSDGNPSDTGQQLIFDSKGDKNANFPWTYFQHKLTLDDDDLILKTFINTPDDSQMDITQDQFRCVQYWGLSVREEVSGFELSQGLRGFAGRNVIASSEIKDLQFPPGTLKGNRIQEDSTNPGLFIPVDVDDDRSYISDNYGPFIKCVDRVPGISANTQAESYIFGSSNYQFYWDNDNTSSYVKMDFFDPGLPDGARHPNETSTSTDVKFKYATMLNGRQFVANVKITEDGNTEEYPNFVMFSNAGSPDVIPTSNFIKLDDLQGGEILGIETLMNDIVVFMTRGIFRINVPSGDPSSWSLVESHPNIGCLNDKAITKTPNGIYFCSKESIVYLDSGFTANIISNPIKDTYQSQASANPSLFRLHYEVKNNRIRLLYTNSSNGSNTLFYLYDISRGVWTNELHTSLSLDEMSIDNNNNTILIEAASSSKIRLLEDTSSYQDGGTVPINIKMRTGF